MDGLLVWGAAGQARMLRGAIAAAGLDVRIVVDRNPARTSPFAGATMIADLPALEAYMRENGDLPSHYVVAIGGHAGKERLRIAQELDALGMAPFSAIDPRAWVADSASIGPGCQILPLAAVAEDSAIESHSIVNTSASVDHECELGRGVHIMPGATIAGCVRIDDFATIGSNATILPRLSIGRGAQVGAGAVVTKDVDDGVVVMGVPARQAGS